MALERAQQARGRALGQPRVVGEIAGRPGLIALDQAYEQLGGAIDSLGACLGRQVLSLMCETHVPQHECRLAFPAGQDPRSRIIRRGARGHVRQPDAALRDPLRGGDGHTRRGWRRIISELGVEFDHDGALEIFRRHGQTVEGQNVKLDPDFVLEQIAKAPREFDVQARNPANTVHMGGDHMVFACVYGPPFVLEG